MAPAAESVAGVWRGRLAAAAAVAVLAALYAPSLAAHVREGERRYNDDVCQHLSPFLRPLSDGPADYIDRYCRATLPTGYRAIFSAARAFDGVRPLSRFLPGALLILTAAGAAAAAARFAGVAGGFAAAALVLSADVFLARMTGGLPRAFAFPIFAAAAAAAARGRPAGVAAAAVAGAALYPSIAVPAGLGLAALCLPPARWTGLDPAAWPRRRRWTLLALAAALCAFAILPNAIALRPYGGRIVRRSLEAYPEAARGGRLGEGDRIDFRPSLGSCLREMPPLAFRSGGRPWRDARDAAGAPLIPDAAILAILALLGASAAVRTREGRRLLALTLGAPAAFLLARAASPLLYLPQRHLFYPLIALAPVWLVAGAAQVPALGAAWIGLARRRPAPRVPSWAAGVAALLAAGGLLLAQGGRVNPSAGYTARDEPESGFHRFVESLPADAFLAGWPNAMSPIPFVHRRAVYVSYEAHLPFHAGYLDEMRRRMHALIAASFATDPEPLLRLRDDGVTHLVVERRHLAGAPNRYFRPFGSAILRAAKTVTPETSEALSRQPQAVVYADADRVVLDLSKVEPESTGPANP